MALIHCPECNHEVSDKAKACPNCGHPFESQPTIVLKKSRWKIVSIIIVAFIILVIGVFFIFRSFWAKVFLSEENYKLYMIYKGFKDISGIGGSCDTFYDYSSKDKKNQWLTVRWIEEVDGVQLLCEGCETGNYDLYIPNEEQGYNLDQKIKEGLNVDEELKENNRDNFFAGNRKTIRLYYYRYKRNIKEDVKEMSDKRIVKLPLLFR